MSHVVVRLPIFPTADAGAERRLAWYDAARESMNQRAKTGHAVSKQWQRFAQNFALPYCMDMSSDFRAGQINDKGNEFAAPFFPRDHACKPQNPAINIMEFHRIASPLNPDVDCLWSVITLANRMICLLVITASAVSMAWGQAAWPTLIIHHGKIVTVDANLRVVEAMAIKDRPDCRRGFER